jgi:hypothetical protein
MAVPPQVEEEVVKNFFTQKLGTLGNRDTGHWC